MLETERAMGACFDESNLLASLAALNSRLLASEICELGRE